MRHASLIKEIGYQLTKNLLYCAGVVVAVVAIILVAAVMSQVVNYLGGIVDWSL